MTVAAILLAAGESSRMGRPKPLLDWFGTTLVEAQVNSLLEGGVDEVFVVTGKSDRGVAPVLDGVAGVHRVYNPDFEEGKTTSIKAGLAALPPGIDAIVLLAVDQPRPPWVISRVLKAHAESGAPITSPRFDGHGGHPLVFDGSLQPELMAITEEQEGIREVIQRHSSELNRVEFESGVIRLDLNTPEAYEQALTEYPGLSKTPEG